MAKRLYPSSLKTYLASNQQNYVADLFQITLQTGAVINATSATSGQQDITVHAGTAGWANADGSGIATTTFAATTYGVWSRGVITSKAGFDLQAQTMDLTCVPFAGTTFPGLNIGLLNAALYNLFDAATVSVWTVYMPIGEYGNVSYGVDTQFFGSIKNFTSLDTTHVEFECGDPFYLLGLKIPTRKFQPGDPFTLGSVNNGINLNGTDINGHKITQAFTAGSGSTQYVLTPTVSFTQPAGYFTQGPCVCTNGANMGLSQTVKLHASGQLTMMNPWLLTPNVGDTFSVVAGYDGTATTAEEKFGSLATFGGTPFVPPQTDAI